MLHKSCFNTFFRFSSLSPPEKVFLGPFTSINLSADVHRIVERCWAFPFHFGYVLGFRSVLIFSAFSTAVSYIFHQGGTHSISLCLLSLVRLTWCRQKEFLLSTYHVAGDQNFRTVYIQRKFVFPSEWTLLEDIFDRICLFFGRRKWTYLFRSSISGFQGIARGQQTRTRGQ